VVVARELTKVHEEFVRGTADEVRRKFAERAEIRGEIVVVVGPPDEPGSPPVPRERARQVYEGLLAAGLSPQEARKITADQLNLSRREVYRSVHRLTD
jgi:16S rRNA (cytidine1402-2'-O)-methyltransferase